MRHRKQRGSLGLVSSHRKALLRNITTDFLRHEKVTTTEAKGRELCRTGDWMITLGKRGDLHARRQALAYIRDKKVVHKLFDTLADRYSTRKGGYSRMIHIGHRRGDAARMVIVELVDRPVVVGESDSKKKKTVKERLSGLRRKK